MYIELRSYENRATLGDKLAPPMRETLIPLLKNEPGFVFYWAMASDAALCWVMSLRITGPLDEPVLKLASGPRLKTAYYRRQMKSLPVTC